MVDLVLALEESSTPIFIMTAPVNTTSSSEQGFPFPTSFRYLLPFVFLTMADDTGVRHSLKDIFQFSRGLRMLSRLLNIYNLCMFLLLRISVQLHRTLFILAIRLRSHSEREGERLWEQDIWKSNVKCPLLGVTCLWQS